MKKGNDTERLAAKLGIHFPSTETSAHSHETISLNTRKQIVEYCLIQKLTNQSNDFEDILWSAQFGSSDIEISASAYTFYADYINDVLDLFEIHGIIQTKEFLKLARQAQRKQRIPRVNRLPNQNRLPKTVSVQEVYQISNSMIEGLSLNEVLFITLLYDPYAASTGTSIPQYVSALLVHANENRQVNRLVAIVHQYFPHVDFSVLNLEPKVRTYHEIRILRQYSDLLTPEVMSKLSRFQDELGPGITQKLSMKRKVLTKIAKLLGYVDKSDNKNLGVSNVLWKVIKRKEESLFYLAYYHFTGETLF